MKQKEKSKQNPTPMPKCQSSCGGPGWLEDGVLMIDCQKHKRVERF
jgi:hypothetical protein